jgi:thiamine pyrophosphate-dependent acetolactate synthase large subunit-like protein
MPTPDVQRYQPPRPPLPAAEDVRRAVQALVSAQQPVILAGRVSRSQEGWQARVALAEKLGARVLTDLKVGAAFPTRHPLHTGPAGFFLTPPVAQALRSADVVLSLDWLDLAGTLKQAWPDQPVPAQVISVSMDHQLHNGWSMDHQGLPPADIFMACEPEEAVDALLAALADRQAPPLPSAPALAALPSPEPQDELAVATVEALERELAAAQARHLAQMAAVADSVEQMEAAVRAEVEGILRAVDDVDAMVAKYSAQPSHAT